MPKKSIALKSLYSIVIDCLVSGNFYVDDQGFGISYYLPKHNLYIHTYIERGYIRIQSNKKHTWISKYE